MTLLLSEFERTTGRRTALYGGSDVFDRAIDDKADFVIADFSKPGMEAFVMGGHGRWPRTVFANEMAIIGPPEAPAGVRGMTDAAAALKLPPAYTYLHSQDDPPGAQNDELQ